MNPYLTDEELEAPLDAETEASIEEALKNATDPEDQDVAISASFDGGARMLLLQLKTGQRIAIPQEDLQEIHKADPADLIDVKLMAAGTALHWEKLGEGMLVKYLRQGFYGSKRWMDGLAQRHRGCLKAS